MRVKMILPALQEAESSYWRPIKYSLFPPLGLETLAAYFSDNDDVEIQDQHIEKIKLDDTLYLVCIQVYVTNAYRAYKIADEYRRRGVYVVMGGWKKFEPFWNFMIQYGNLNRMLPVLENLLTNTNGHKTKSKMSKHGIDLLKKTAL